MLSRLAYRSTSSSASTSKVFTRLCAGARPRLSTEDDNDSFCYRSAFGQQVPSSVHSDGDISKRRTRTAVSTPASGSQSASQSSSGATVSSNVAVSQKQKNFGQAILKSRNVNQLAKVLSEAPSFFEEGENADDVNLATALFQFGKFAKVITEHGGSSSSNVANCGFTEKEILRLDNLVQTLSTNFAETNLVEKNMRFMTISNACHGAAECLTYFQFLQNMSSGSFLRRVEKAIDRLQAFLLQIAESAYVKSKLKTCKRRELVQVASAVSSVCVSVKAHPIHMETLSNFLKVVEQEGVLRVGDFESRHLMSMALALAIPHTRGSPHFFQAAGNRILEDPDLILSSQQIAGLMVALARTKNKSCSPKLIPYLTESFTKYLNSTIAMVVNVSGASNDHIDHNLCNSILTNTMGQVTGREVSNVLWSLVSWRETPILNKSFADLLRACSTLISAQNNNFGACGETVERSWLA